MQQASEQEATAKEFSRDMEDVFNFITNKIALNNELKADQDLLKSISALREMIQEVGTMDDNIIEEQEEVPQQPPPQQTIVYAPPQQYYPPRSYSSRSSYGRGRYY
uniref:Uncharacterized protein n=1 Tax=Cruciviridae sp. TaxID=1955495 RepID=A0A1S6LVG8_9VIRU|nr:hypothetical protein [Cruciviridae sp.]